MGLRIVLVHNHYRSAEPSGEDRVVEVERGLLEAAGVEVVGFERRSDDIAAMPLHRRALVPLQVPWNRRARLDLRQVLRGRRPDAVHVHCTFPLISPSVLAACRDEDVPVVATLHNYTQVCAPGTLFRDGRPCSDCVGRLPLPAVRHGCYRGSALATAPVAVGLAVNRRRWWSDVDRFLCISHAQRDLLVAAGMPAERLSVHPNVVAEPARLRRDAGRHVLYLGRLTEAKGVRLLVRAWDRRPHHRLPLVLAGAGPLAAEVTAWAASRDDVRFVGLRSRAECTDLLAEAAALVAPSLWPEPFGLVAAEAMAVGVPVVAAAHGALAEIVEHRRTGLLVTPGDAAGLDAALDAVATDRAANLAMGRAARATYARTWTAEAGLDRLLATYDSLRSPGSPA